MPKPFNAPNDFFCSKMPANQKQAMAPHFAKFVTDVQALLDRHAANQIDPFQLYEELWLLQWNFDWRPKNRLTDRADAAYERSCTHDVAGQPLKPVGNLSDCWPYRDMKK